MNNLSDLRPTLRLAYENGLTVEELANLHSVAPQTMNYHLKRAGTIMRSNRGHRIHAIDVGFFDDIANEQQAYWLGFLLADGCFVGNTFTLGLGHKDKAHLELFKTTVKSQHPISVRPSAFGSISAISLSCKQWATALIARGWKEFKKVDDPHIFDTVPPALQRHCLRGFFDGDGCITRSRTTAKQQRVIKFCGSPLIMRWIISHLYHQGIVNTPFKTLIPNKRRTIHVVQWAGDPTAARFHDYCYSEATVFLDRKRRRFLEDDWLKS